MCVRSHPHHRLVRAENSRTRSTLRPTARHIIAWRIVCSMRRVVLDTSRLVSLRVDPLELEASHSWTATLTVRLRSSSGTPPPASWFPAELSAAEREGASASQDDVEPFDV